MFVNSGTHFFNFGYHSVKESSVYRRWWGNIRVLEFIGKETGGGENKIFDRNSEVGVTINDGSGLRLRGDSKVMLVWHDRNCNASEVPELLN
jgi:hypothetical protein